MTRLVELKEDAVFEMLQQHLGDLISWDDDAAQVVAEYMETDIKSVPSSLYHSERFLVVLGDLFFYEMWKRGQSARA
jgi:hypothetical protein